MTAQRIGLVAALGVSAVPLVLVLWLIAHHSANVPFQDEWDFFDRVAPATHDRPATLDLWSQHNEHRLVLPLAVYALLVRATRWDTRYALLVNVGCTLATFLVLVRLAARTLGRDHPRLLVAMVPATSLLLFSGAAYEVWLSGPTLPFPMSVLTASLTVLAVAEGSVTAVGWAVLALLTFTNGLVVLALVPIGFGLTQPAPRRRRLVGLAVAAAIATVAVYLAGFRFSVQDPLVSARHPLDMAIYSLAFLGSPLAGGSGTVAVLWGTAGLLVLLVSAAWLWTRARELRPVVVPWLVLASYGAASGLMAGLGRLGFGVGQSMTSRYVVFSSLFWVSVGALGGLALVRYGRTAPARRRLGIGVVAGLIVALATVSLGLSWQTGKVRAARLGDRIRRGAECVKEYRHAPPSCLELVYPTARRVRIVAPRLEAAGLGPFAPPPR